MTTKNESSECLVGFAVRILVVLARTVSSPLVCFLIYDLIEKWNYFLCFQ